MKWVKKYQSKIFDKAKKTTIQKIKIKSNKKKNDGWWNHKKNINS
jgi:hypothetical protein